LLAHKINTLFDRYKGRDFFDVVFLMSKTAPDYAYLKEKTGITCKQDMLAALRARISKLDMKSLANDVEPFLFNADQKKRVASFEQWLDSV
jgi:predicted nucleotidyltransferase component of viral defense system